jgi:hypothetical protein
MFFKINIRKRKKLREILPATSSSTPVRSVVGRLRAVGGVKIDSIFE